MDSSTQSCTVELRDADDGRLLGTGRAPHPVTYPPRSEQHPSAWWEALRLALAAATDQARVPVTDIDAMSVAAQCHGLVALDAADEVIRPAKLWNDTTSADEARELVARLGAPAWVRSIGLTPTAALTISKLRWLARHEPENLRRLRSVMVPHDWLTSRLTGRRTTDRSDASGTGYYSAAESRWRTDLLEEFVSDEVDWAAALPDVLGPSEPSGTVTSAAAAELGLRPDVVVGPGGGDQHLGAVGLGLRTGDVTYSLGTSGVVLALSEAPVLDERGWVDGVADATGAYLPLVCTLNATKVTDTVARWLGVPVTELSELALQADRSGPRPVLVAYLDGERSPSLPGARGLLGGLTTSTTREQIALSAFEGVLLGLVRGEEALRACGVPVDGTVVVAGGGGRSPAYRQVLADLTGRPVHTVDAPEATARGACVQAAAVLSGADVRDVRDDWRPPVTSATEPSRTPVRSVRDDYTDLARWQVG
ncbi:xylulokinase [Modestobacter sp. I12A-02662]|uniref:xylulokinase n=1 Tax=Modestobacter sp. I12A-02662 TaxID=1730496 RepID=UPI0034DE2F14